MGLSPLADFGYSSITVAFQFADVELFLNHSGSQIRWASRVSWIGPGTKVGKDCLPNTLLRRARAGAVRTAALWRDAP